MYFIFLERLFTSFNMWHTSDLRPVQGTNAKKDQMLQDIYESPS